MIMEDREKISKHIDIHEENKNEALRITTSY